MKESDLSKSKADGKGTSPYQARGRDIISAMTAKPDMVIRVATNNDCASVIHLVSSVLAEFQLPFEPGSKDADLADIEAMYLSAGGTFEVIEDYSGRILGTYGLFPLNDKTCELRKMYFLPEIRGFGIGLQVLERAVSHARRLGFTTIVLETQSVLRRAIKLYTRFGFVPTPMDHPTARVDQRFILELNAQVDLKNPG